MADTTIAEKLAETEAQRQRIASNIASAYDVIETKGGTLPADENSANLSTAIATIPTGTTPSGTINITTNGTHDVTQYASANVNVDDGQSTINAIIDGSVTSITSNATTVRTDCFKGVTSLLSVSIPNAANIGNNAFYGCDAMTNIIMPSATVLGNSAFCYCSSLALVSLPSGITNVGDFTFSYCSVLALTSLPDGITSIGNNAFERCEAMSLTSLPNSLTSIGGYAFWRCYQLDISSFPNSLTSIGANAFGNCTKIQSIDVSEMTQIPSLANSNAFVGTTFPFLFADQTQLDEWASATNWSDLADRFQIKSST